jgi:hypothetical protein
MLALRDIHVADRVFQPRLIEANRYASEEHIRELARAIRAQGEPLDPLLVVAIGPQFFIVDGHHRHAAYHAVEWDQPVPVEVFSGTLAQAIDEAIRRNSKNKLSMYKNDKLESAWRLVKAGDHRTVEIMKLTTVSNRTVATMKKVLANGGYQVRELPWWEARRASSQAPDASDDSWRTYWVDNFVERLAKHFGGDIQHHEDLFAEALEKMDKRLPEKLCQQWPDAARRAVETQAADDKV